MMGTIFRGASRVVVWLGRSTPATDLALKKARPFLSHRRRAAGRHDDDMSGVV